MSNLEEIQHSSTSQMLADIKESTFQAFNLARMISEVGAKFQIRDLSQIEGRKKLSFDDLASYT